MNLIAMPLQKGPREQFPVAFLRRTTVADVTHAAARLIGRMLGAAGAADAVDGHLVLLARQHGWPVLTADPDDLLTIDPTLVIERL